MPTFVFVFLVLPTLLCFLDRHIALSRVLCLVSILLARVVLSTPPFPQLRKVIEEQEKRRHLRTTKGVLEKESDKTDQQRRNASKDDDD